MNTSARDAGLIRSVGTWGLAASIVNMVIGASIFVVPAPLAANVGVYAPFAIVACAIAVGAVAICFAEGGSRLPSSGGAYGYIESAFGPMAGYAAGTLLWFGDVLACGGIAAALADVLVGLLPQAHAGIARALVITGTIVGVALVNMSGVDRGMRLVKATVLAKLAPLAVFLVVGAFALHGANFHHPAPLSGVGVGRAIILVVFAFMGMETALCASGEVARPERTIPRALALALGMVTLVYLGIQTVAQGMLGAALATSTAPLADAMARVNPMLRLLMLAGTSLSMFGYLSSDILGSPRILFAFARDGLLPSALGRVHPETRAPHVAIGCYALLAIVLALSGTFVELAVLSALTTAGFYIAGCAASWRLARTNFTGGGAPLNFRWLGAAAFIGIASMIGLIAVASRAEILGLFALIGASLVIYSLQTRWLRWRSAPL